MQKKVQALSPGGPRGTLKQSSIFKYVILVVPSSINFASKLPDRPTVTRIVSSQPPNTPSIISNFPCFKDTDRPRPDASLKRYTNEMCNKTGSMLE